jgi:hypothetical protein
MKHRHLAEETQITLSTAVLMVAALLALVART